MGRLMKKSNLWRGLALAAAVAVVALGAIIVVPGLLLGIALSLGSQRTVFARVTSPDGWNEARVQFDDAGAVSSFDRIVFVKNRWNPSDEPLLSCRAFWADGEDSVHLRWLDQHTLLIRHAFPSQAIEAVAPKCGAVRIVVQSLPQTRAGG